MKKMNIILLIISLHAQSSTFSQNIIIDTTKMDVFMTKAQLWSVNLEIDFIPFFVETPNKFIFLSSKTNLYILGNEGMIKILDYHEIESLNESQKGIAAKGGLNFAPFKLTVNSFTVTNQGDLYIVHNESLDYYNEEKNVETVAHLPEFNSLKLSAGKKHLFLYDNGVSNSQFTNLYETGRNNNYAIYQFARYTEYQKIIDVPTPVNSVLEVENYILFATLNKLYAIDLENKAMKEIAVVENPADNKKKGEKENISSMDENTIISMIYDSLYKALYFSTLKAIFRMKDGKIDCVNDQFGGLLQCDDAGLMVFNPTESFIVRMRNNALYSASTLVQKVTPLQQSTVPTSNTISTMPTVSNPSAHAPSPTSYSPTNQTITYNTSTLLVSISGEKYEAQQGYYFIGTFKDGKIETGTVYNTEGKAVKTFFIK